MSRPTRAQLAENVSEFARSILASDDRWKYALKVCAMPSDPDGMWFLEKPVRAVGRLFNLDARSTSARLIAIRKHGSIKAARAWYGERSFWQGRDAYEAPLLEQWHIGHVYFARLEKFPHVLKVGFSRRLHERIEDIEGKCRVQVGDVTTQVGTMADEARWHHLLQDNCIDGEWFFDPKSSDRNLPSFLMREAA